MKLYLVEEDPVKFDDLEPGDFIEHSFGNFPPQRCTFIRRELYGGYPVMIVELPEEPGVLRRLGHDDGYSKYYKINDK